MRRSIGFAALLVLASTAYAQDTTVVVVRHLPAQQDTGVTVRHLAPPPAQRATVRPGSARYGTRTAGVFAKDPNLGSMLSLIFPGGGQYYAGADGKGLAITMISFGAPIIGYANVRREPRYSFYNGQNPQPIDNCVNNSGPGSGGSVCRNHYDWTPAAIGLGVGITAWLYGVATAGSDVQHWNQAHGVRFVSGPGRVGFAVAVP